MRPFHALLLAPRRLDRPASTWSKQVLGWAGGPGPAARISLEPLAGGAGWLGVCGDPKAVTETLTELAYEAFRARAGDRNPLRAYWLGHAGGRLHVPVVRVPVHFHRGRHQGVGLLELGPDPEATTLPGTPARWVRLGWRDGGEPWGDCSPVPNCPGVLRGQLVLDPPVGQVSQAEDVELLLRADGHVPHSEAVVIPGRELDEETTAEMERRRRRLREWLFRGWDQVSRPLISDALELSNALAPWLGRDVNLERSDQGMSDPSDGALRATGLRIRAPGHTDPGVRLRYAWMLARPGSGTFAEAVANTFRADLQAAVRPWGLESGIGPGSSARGDQGEEDGRGWSPDSGGWEQIERLGGALFEDIDDFRWFEATILDPARKPLPGGDRYDGDAGMAGVVETLARGGGVARGTRAWRNALWTLLACAFGEIPADIDALVASARRPGQALPSLKRLEGEPLTFLYRSATPTSLDTWAWLLPRGTVLRPVPNRLDDPMCALDDALVLED